METVEKLGEEIGLRRACDAIGMPRASIYRQRRGAPVDSESKTNPRSSPRSMTPGERNMVREELFAERHINASPREIYAKLLDEGKYSANVVARSKFWNYATIFTVHFNLRVKCVI